MLNQPTLHKALRHRQWFLLPTVDIELLLTADGSWVTMVIDLVASNRSGSLLPLPISISGCNHEGNHEGNHGSESADQVLIDTMVFLTLIQPHRFFLLSFFLLAWFSMFFLLMVTNVAINHSIYS